MSQWNWFKARSSQAAKKAAIASSQQSQQQQQQQQQRDQKVYSLQGVEVPFPYSAYPSQLSMMSRVVQSCLASQCCLVESPTGSGKSLSLLCASLAWLRHFKATNSQASSSNEDDADRFDSDFGHPTDSSTGATSATPASVYTNCCSDCRSVDPTITAGNDAQAQKILNCENCVCHQAALLEALDREKQQQQQGGNSKVKIPKIFFGTRTHKQISQLVRELRKTAFADVPMSVLSSREHSCVHPTVLGSRGRGKTELCRELVKESSCSYYSRRTSADTQKKVRDNYGLRPAWDIEDLVNALTAHKSTSACPYYTARALMEQADLIFCPYNYLIDPTVRRSMKINVKNHIVILDEAHNIEDACREAASLTITEEQLLRAKKNLEEFCKDSELERDAAALLDTVTKLLNVMQSGASKLRATGFNQLEHIWDAQEMLGLLRYAGIQLTEGTHVTLTQHLGVIVQTMEERAAAQRGGPPPDADDMDGVAWMPVRRRGAATAAGASRGASAQNLSLDPVTVQALEAFLLVCDFLTRDSCRFATDYRVALQKVKAVLQPTVQPGQWLSKRQQQQQQQQDSPEQTLSLSFWCLNPAVAFADLGSGARCVILTSGTLSPMASFQSELGQAFPLKLEANHVIKPEQLLVCSVASGPTGRTLCANYQNSERFEFQDELGLLLASVCDTVPHGVLCFMPSYTFLEKMRARWASTGLLAKIEQRKELVVEPRGSAAEFEEAMRTFIARIDASKEEAVANQRLGRGCTGALLLAVCRGKMSEGIDFSDEQCRACITVGIPYPSVRDTLVSLKRRYNDQHAKQRTLLDGGQWYETQAFRALNQALGRCIRHRHDWGALLLVDERFTQRSGRYLTGLSRWVRSRATSCDTFQEVKSRLTQFVSARTAAAADASASPCAAASLAVMAETRQSPPPLSPAVESLGTPSGKRRLFGRDASVSASPLVIERINLISDDEEVNKEDKHDVQSNGAHEAKRPKLNSAPGTGSSLACFACGNAAAGLSFDELVGEVDESAAEMPAYCAQLLSAAAAACGQPESSLLLRRCLRRHPASLESLESLTMSMAETPAGSSKQPPLNCYHSSSDSAFVAWLQCRQCGATVGAVQLAPLLSNGASLVYLLSRR